MRHVLTSLVGLALATALLAFAAGAAQAKLRAYAPWPSAAPGGDIVEIPVRFASSSPFTLDEVGDAPGAKASGLYVTPKDRRSGPWPAVILLHGAGGVIGRREVAYARQLARQGVAALVVDAFGPRRDLATRFTERLIRITETMMLADAYAGLAWLAARPEIDGQRVALVGFSYGGIASILAAYRQVADHLVPNGPRFAAHVAFYSPCIARFAEPATTGAPALMLWGGRDAIVDGERCQEIAADLRRGGSRVETRVFADAMHQWDGASSRPWRASRGLAECRFSVSADGSVYDQNTHLPMLGPRTRTLILAACADSDGYLIGRDDAVRAQSNRALATFLAPILFPDAETPDQSRQEHQSVAPSQTQ